MTQYIDKAAVVAEINRRIAFFSDINNKQVIDSNLDCAIAFAGLRDFLDTLEVKEVDLEKELDTWRHNHFHGRRDDDYSGEYLERSSQLDIAKHFFELGMQVSNKVQKGE